MTDSDTHVIKAACYCGNFNIDVPVRKSSLPLPAAFCHCNRCRRSSGTLGASYLPLDKEGFTPDPAVINRLKGYKTTEKITRYFCGTCSTHVLWHGPEEHNWEITTGCLDRLDGVVQFTKHIYIEDTIDGGMSDWASDDAGKPLQRNATRTGRGELESGWCGEKASPTTPSPDRLHAHCDCGGVNIYIARPSPSSEDVLVPHDSGPPNSAENETWWLRADKQKFLGSVCACNSCRLANGFELTFWAFVPTSDISLDKDGKVPFSREFGTLASYRSSDKATRRFCGTCGATVFWDGDVRPGLIDVAVGLLDAPEGARAESLVEYATERVSFREDAESRAIGLVEAVEKSLSAWGKDVQGRDGPHGSFVKAHGGNILAG